MSEDQIRTFAQAVSVMDRDLIQTALISLMSNVQDIGRQLEAARDMAVHDSLTGLYNRAGFLEHLKRVIAHTERSDAIVQPQPEFAIVFIDMDGLKPINDFMGHEAGDAALKALAEGLRQNVRADEIAARLGGDEFAVILNLHGDENTLDGAKARLDAAFDGMSFVHGDHRFPLRASIGVVAVEPDADIITHLAAADAAMYEVKQARTAMRDAGPPEALVI